MWTQEAIDEQGGDGGGSGGGGEQDCSLLELL